MAIYTVVVDILVKAIKPLGLHKFVQRPLALQRNKPLKTNVYRFVVWLRVHTARYHLYAPVEDVKASVPPAIAVHSWAIGRQRWQQQWTSPALPSPRLRQNECAPGESERLLKEQMDKWESARNKKVTKLQGSANTSLGREGKIEGIVYVTTTLLNSGSDVTMLTAGVMKSLERAVVEIKVISPELSVIQPYGQAPALKVDRKVLFKLVTRDTP
ncbi:hypothetical protein DYB26_013132 [Aphanomyces astaci]|uniref:Peptidase A2 domain-containing protein n=1 Tax=Aphanomyces astaci TaxID=112090 RepID=A0A3R7C545_APHAT|nr:hypothetical protein DYB26_013132 [Aphanomyces astaci]